MTQSQIQEAIKADPWGYHQAVLERSNQDLNRVFQSAGQGMQNFLDQTVGGLIAIIKLHSEELAIFRTMESHIVNGTGTDTIMTDLFAKLNVFREQAKQRAATAQASKPAA